MAAPAPRCRTHHLPAGWKCTACKSPLCPDCAAIQKVQHVEMVVCTLCRELAHPLTRHRADEASYLQRLPGAFAWPFTREALFSLAGVAAFVGVFSWFGGLGRTAASLGLYATSYAIIRMTASNRDHFFVEVSAGFELGWPVFKSALIYLVLLFVAALYVVYFKARGAPMLSYLLDPVLLLLAFTAFVLGPMTTLMAACHAPFVQMINPALVFAYIGKIGSDYWVALAAIFVLGALGGFAGFLIRILGTLPFNLLPVLLGAAVEVYLAFVSARMLGLLLFLHGDRLGYGIQSDYETPLFGAAMPHGRLPDKVVREVDASLPEHVGDPATDAPPVPRSHAPLEFDQSSPAAPMELVGANETPAAGEAPVRELDASALPSAGDFFGRSLRESAARGDWSTALDTWKASADKAALGLNAEHLTGLGRTAASQGENAVAREVLELAAQGDAVDVSCARAKVFLGRLLQERFNDPAGAQVLFKEVLAKAPDSDAAQFARKMLKP